MPPEVPRTGRLVVALTPEAVAAIARWAGQPHTAGLSELTEVADLGFPSLRQVFADFGHPPSFRAIRSISLERIFALDELARRGPFPPSRSLAAYWIVVPPPGRQVEMLRALSAATAAIDAVDLEQAVGPPPVNWNDDAFASSQFHLDPAPAGIDAKWVWSLGLDGTGMGFVDLEMGWNVQHEDLQAKMPGALLCHTNSTGFRERHHGTQTLGIVVGIDNAVGIVGIAPGIAKIGLASHWDGNSANNVADAIGQAADAMNPGDVLLLETQGGGGWPIELLVGNAEMDAIKAATSGKDIIVLEPAGNNGAGNTGMDVDPWLPPSKDSGAIMVGASVGDPPGPGLGAVAHARLGSSNYGLRVNCFAPGGGLITTGVGDLWNGGPNATYTSGFGATSGASAIVAGAALLTQHLYSSACNARLKPAEMRALLVKGGTVQGPSAGKIGFMPDLRAIARQLCDVYLRDYVGDDGQEPSSGPLSSSPDVIVAGGPVPDPQASYGEGSGTENDAALGAGVATGVDHSVYVRIRNRGRCPAANVTATVYWSEVATLVTPGAWNLIGTSTPVTVPPGDVLTVAPAVLWPAAQIPGPGHYCFVAEVRHAYDPAPPQPPPTDWAGFRQYLRRSNNVTWRNFHVLDPEMFSLEAGAWFWMCGAPDMRRRFDFEIHSRLPPAARLLLEVPFELLPSLKAAPFAKDVDHRRGRLILSLAGLRPVLFPAVRLNQNARHRCRFFLAEALEELSERSGSLVIRQLHEGEEVGRITWVVRPNRRLRRPRE